VIPKPETVAEHPHPGTGNPVPATRAVESRAGATKIISGDARITETMNQNVALDMRPADSSYSDVRGSRPVPVGETFGPRLPCGGSRPAGGSDCGRPVASAEVAAERCAQERSELDWKNLPVESEDDVPELED
jgi:hypothetical protein